MIKNYSKQFKDYMEFIVNNKNYYGLPFEYKKNGDIKWVASPKSKIGIKRQKWIDDKAQELGLDPKKSGSNAKVALKIHPTKEKPCQICGKTMSLYYVYPSKNFIKFLEKNYNYIHNTYNSIYDIIKFLRDSCVSENNIKDMLSKKAKLKLNANNLTMDCLINNIELNCRLYNSKLLGPGAMSDYPDRFDGFHSYNRCCRSTSDKGRSAANLRLYGKDRRAYEYLNDGNIVAANNFMNSDYFKNSSADHIGPISLGFVHDPHFIQKMSSSQNSSKRDRLYFKDFNKLKDIEKDQNINPSSWYSSQIWSDMKKHVKNNKDLALYRNKLKINLCNFMEILWLIKNNNGEKFLKENLIYPKIKYFKYNYKFTNNQTGEYKKYKKKLSKQRKKEIDRFIRVFFKSIEDYHEKDNRRSKIKIDNSIMSELSIFIANLNNDKKEATFNDLRSIIIDMQNHLLNNS